MSEKSCKNCKRLSPWFFCDYEHIELKPHEFKLANQCSSYDEKIMEKDPVNPSHYTQGKIECIDAIEAALTPEEFRGFLKGNVYKYMWRHKNKNGLEDVKKGDWYYARLIKNLEEEVGE